MDRERGSINLDSDWLPSDGDAGVLTLTLTNSSDRLLKNFRLAFTSHVQIDPRSKLRGARLVEQISTYHVIAPPAGLVLAPGHSWSVYADRLSYSPQYTSGLKSGYLVLENGDIVAVEVRPTTRGQRGGMPRLAAPLPSSLPPAALPVAIIPFPRVIEVAGRRDAAGTLQLLEGPREAELAFHAAANSATRLFASAPPLFGHAGAISCAARHADMSEEAYRIDFTADAVAVCASAQSGFFYAFVTLGQILRSARERPDKFLFPQRGQIIDAPRLRWRGMLLDVARQVFTVEELLRLLDHLAWHKLNRLHLHLGDDEGWRLDIPGYPQVAELAGWRGHGLAVPPLLGSAAERYGMIYSPADIGRLTRQGEQLFVAIVPEINVPGHNYCVLQALPELRDSVETGTYRSVQNFPNNALNPAVPKTYDFLESVLHEVARLFPSRWIHIGADEVADDAWLGSSLARRFMRQHGWREIYQLQSHFLRRVQEIVRGLGRGTGAWQEAALGGGIDAHDCYLVAWRDAASGMALARQGYDVVLAPAQAYYLDMAQSADWWEPGASWAGDVSLERCYAYDPGGDWPSEMNARLLGVEACLWSENLHDRRLADYMTFPRLSAIAESAWTPAERKDFRRFAATLAFMPRAVCS
jgi:hexosaminidase